MFLGHSPLEKQMDEEDGVTENLLGRQLTSYRRTERSQFKGFWVLYWAYLTHGALLFLSMFFFSLWVHDRGQHTNSVYSPAAGAVEYLKELTVFNGTLNYPSEFRGYPTPEIDAAWRRISTDVRATRLTLEQVLAIGKQATPSKVKFRDEDGGGYLATLEFPHQLHCLDILRKYTYREYYENADPYFLAKPEIFRAHLDHCIEILRQNLMCTADVGMITFEWVRGHEEPYPDFNTKHQCRNFEKLLTWADKNAVHIQHGRVARSGDEVDLTEPP